MILRRADDGSIVLQQLQRSTYCAARWDGDVECNLLFRTTSLGDHAARHAYHSREYEFRSRCSQRFRRRVAARHRSASDADSARCFDVADLVADRDDLRDADAEALRIRRNFAGLPNGEAP